MSDERKQEITIIKTEKRLFLKIKNISLVCREKPPYQYDITTVHVFTAIITDVQRKVQLKFYRHLSFIRGNYQTEIKYQSGCGLTRMTFSPRMKSWLMWRVWTLPYVWDSFFWQTFGETLCSSRLVLTQSDFLDSVPLYPLLLGLWAGWRLPAVSWASSPAELSWTFSFSKSCTDISVTLIFVD